MADKLESLKKDLRSVLLTEKNGIAINRLDREYRDVTGSGIEFNRSEHRNLQSFLETIPDTVRIVKLVAFLRIEAFAFFPDFRIVNSNL